MIEIWRPVPSCPGWLASSHGRVWRPESKIPMPNGGVKTLTVEPTFGLFDTKKSRFKQNANHRTIWVSVMVCEAFKGAKPDTSLHCLHIDEDSTNNKQDNLKWGTRSENQSAPGCTAKRSASMRRSWNQRRGEVSCQQHR